MSQDLAGARARLLTALRNCEAKARECAAVLVTHDWREITEARVAGFWLLRCRHCQDWLSPLGYYLNELVDRGPPRACQGRMH